jgi:DNA polymerase (family 10)
MAEHCRSIGLEYFGICDHSRSAFYANGLSVDRVLEQHREIDALNQEFAPFRILKGIESDILPDGSLDYPDDILGLFDIVVASVHSGLKMDKTKATERLLKAISNPYTTVLGHPTGRLLLAREGYPVDMEAVIDACVAHNVVIELNANPYRLDLDWRWIRKAVLKGAQISINPDAHRKEGIRDMYYGVCVARKGFLKPEQTFNARNLNSVMDHLANKKQQVKPVEKPSA